jgi:hypothetical protein
VEDLGVERSRRLGMLVCGVGVTLMLVGIVPSPATTASATTGQSNNGDVKVQDAGDSNFPPENDPHVDCPFDLVFYNFDAGQQVTATLQGQPPSGDNTQLVWGPTVVVADANGFARVHIQAGDLNLAGLSAHPEGGANDLDDKHTVQRDSDEPTFHLKLDVQTFAGQHLFKHKVFWVGECAIGSTTPTSASTTTSTTSTTVESASPTTASSTSTSSTTSVTVAAGASTTVAGASTVLGSSQTTPSSTGPNGTASVSATSNRSLPFTGGGAAVGWIGVALAVGGLVFSQASRRRRS